MASLKANADREHAARLRVHAAVNLLNRRSGRPPADLPAGRLPEPTERSAGDLALLADLAEAVARLDERLERLEATATTPAAKRGR